MQLNDITVDLDVIDVDNTGDIATQSYTLPLTGKVPVDNGIMMIYQSPNFFGYAVTFGAFYKDNTKEIDSSPSASVSCKASVCSPNDEFDKGLGIQIVIGRLVQAEDWDSIVVSKTKEEVEVSLNASVQNAAAELAEYLHHRDECMAMFGMSQRTVNNSLEEQFSRFK